MSKNEKELIQKLKNKDETSLEQVVRKYTGHLFKASLGLGFNDNDADDITQSVWLTFFDVIHQFEGRSSLRTFLFGILYNKASEFRKQSRRHDLTENIEEVIDSHFDSKGLWIASHSPINPEKFLESTQTLSIISHCIELLPLNQKMAFILKEIEEELTEEICHILKITTTNLGVLLFRSRNQLRECIETKSR